MASHGASNTSLAVLRLPPNLCGIFPGSQRRLLFGDVYFCAPLNRSAMQGQLYLIPSPLGEGAIDHVLPQDVCRLISTIRHFVVENERTVRRFLKQVNRDIDINALHFTILDKDTSLLQLPAMLAPIAQGHHVGIVSEAGCPGIADPGATLVALAHERNIRVMPLVGPSSILLALMASGMNGQSFAFNGYLPVKKNEKTEAIKRFELRSMKENQSQVFIEAPYRNLQLLDDMLAICKPATRLCIACDITLTTELIATRTIAQWQKSPKPDLHKRPAIFIIQG